MDDNNDNMVIYSSDLLTVQGDSATGGSQYNSGSSFTQSSCLNVQDLLDCVQKLQNENQQLSQIFFKDKRQREELINQLAEEFDQQVKEVEERAHKRARDELEAEKRRLREMMLEEKEQLQHHYKTIERMSNLVKSVYEEKKRRSSSEAIESNSDLVKSQLEDTYEENRELKRSLLDTKTDVARIWQEMGNLKSKYEKQLSSAYERNQETKTECDHIKRQLLLMKDSNRKLQDASDVITCYITDKVEPVINIATENQDSFHDDPHTYMNNTGLLMTGSECASNSRRGSVLSNYLGAECGDAIEPTTADTITTPDPPIKPPQIITPADIKVSMVEPADGPTVATYDIILVGDSFVGKSSLASRFIEGCYSRNVISTTSIDFKTKDCKVDGVNYTINLWDTAGQERFRSITASYFRKAKGIILMYDVSEKHTYLNIRNWMSTISNSASEGVAVLLLANKIDLREVRGAENCIPLEEGQRLASEYGVLFLETSVKSGQNLESSLVNLIRQMAKNCGPVIEPDRIKLHSRSSSSCMAKQC